MSLGVERLLAEIAERDASLHAWCHLATADDIEGARQADGRLAGVTVGVKDVIDTAGLPTEYGSPIYAGHRPRSDAAVVALLRAAGAVVVGKTVTAELAWFTPGPTVNPHRAAHTPGGSSSGSAAAVAAGMVDLALGTQTAGSVIRPASFCGVFGYKPTFGAVPTAGVKQAAPSLDTVGAFARSVDVLDRAWQVMTGRSEIARTRTNAPRFTLIRTEQWDAATEDCRAVVEGAASAVGAAPHQLPAALVGLAERQPLVQAYEGVRALAWERAAHAERLSEGLRAILDWGAAVPADEHDDVLARAAVGRSPAVVGQLFAGADVLVTPAVVGEAPEGLDHTGDPRFCRLWTLLGFPTLSVPAGTGATGLPIGVQLVARPHADATLLAAGAAISTAISAALGER